MLEKYDKEEEKGGLEGGGHVHNGGFEFHAREISRRRENAT